MTDLQTSVRDMIKAELEGSKQFKKAAEGVGLAGATPLLPPALAALPGPIGAPPGPPAPMPTPQPKVVKLDAYEALMTDAIRWRLDAAQKAFAIATMESKECDKMRADLLNLCVKKYGIDTEKYNIQIDSRDKTMRIELR